MADKNDKGAKPGKGDKAAPPKGGKGAPAPEAKGGKVAKPAKSEAPAGVRPAACRRRRRTMSHG